MVLGGITDKNGNYLTKNSEGFCAWVGPADQTSWEDPSDEELIKEAVIDSLEVVLLAHKYFEWDWANLVYTARNRPAVKFFDEKRKRRC